MTTYTMPDDRLELYWESEPEGRRSKRLIHYLYLVGLPNPIGGLTLTYRGKRHAMWCDLPGVASNRYYTLEEGKSELEWMVVKWFRLVLGEIDTSDIPEVGEEWFSRAKLKRHAPSKQNTET